MYKIKIFLFSLLLVAISTSINAINREEKSINLAVSNAITGPASQLGRRLNQGASAYFTRVNHEGGIGGRKINLVVRDDGYEPFKTLKNTQYFLAQSDIFAFFNFVGTPTTQAILPLVKKSQLPFLMPFTGAEFLRNPIVDNIYNLRASYYQEAQAQIDYLVNVKKIRNIGLLIQADAFGRAVEQGYLKVMKQHGIEPKVVTRYRRNTNDIQLALNILKQHQVAAVGFVGTYQPFAKLINQAYLENFTPYFTTVSFISSSDLFLRIKQPSNILVTEVVPNPNDCQIVVCQSFIKDMQRLGITQLDQVQFEGYLNALVVTQVLQRCQQQLTIACFFSEMKQLKLSLGEVDIEFSDIDHQGLEQVYLNFFDYSNIHRDVQ